MSLLTIQVFQHVTPCPVSGSDISNQASAFIIAAKPSNNIPLYWLLKNEGTTILRSAENRSQNVTASRSEPLTECHGVALRKLQPSGAFLFVPASRPNVGPARLPRDKLSLIWDLLSLLWGLPSLLWDLASLPWGLPRSLCGPPGQLCRGFRDPFEQG